MCKYLVRVRFLQARLRDDILVWGNELSGSTLMAPRFAMPLGELKSEQSQGTWALHPPVLSHWGTDVSAVSLGWWKAPCLEIPSPKEHPAKLRVSLGETWVWGAQGSVSRSIWAHSVMLRLGKRCGGLAGVSGGQGGFGAAGSLVPVFVLSLARCKAELPALGKGW